MPPWLDPGRYIARAAPAAVDIAGHLEQQLTGRARSKTVNVSDQLMEASVCTQVSGLADGLSAKTRPILARPVPLAPACGPGHVLAHRS